MPTGIKSDPYRSHRFRVEIDGIAAASFADVTIPAVNTAPIDYREGTDPAHVRKLSGMNSFGNVTLKRGVTRSMDLHNWYKQVMQNGAEQARKSLSIVLVDDEGNDRARWNVSEAWPIKYETSALSAKSAEVMIETIEIVHEGISRIA
ncbi:MAG: phage tail protein [Leptonema illini]|jgi:phage tail-like protein|uniref:Phage tail protein n=1 Tax=Leptonema illini TaxID=183 RepID=A0A833LX94_9LEPT|nr:MAG: phage tail protein [Leptonema illini]